MVTSYNPSLDIITPSQLSDNDIIPRSNVMVIRHDYDDYLRPRLGTYMGKHAPPLGQKLHMTLHMIEYDML